jgi:hypothetical protein
VIRGQPGQIVLEIPFPKITTAKQTGGMAQAVEHQVCKYKTLNSNPSPTKKIIKAKRTGGVA